MNLKFSALATFAISSAYALDPITFRGSGVAQASPEGGNTLYESPSGNQVGSARFPYVINAKQAPLAKVYLVTPSGTQKILQIDFTAVRQECSCYWLEAKDLKQRFPDLASGDSYHIKIEGNGYSVNSGTIKLVFSSEAKESESDKPKESSSSKSKDETKTKDGETKSLDGDDSEPTETNSPNKKSLGNPKSSSKDEDEETTTSTSTKSSSKSNTSSETSTSTKSSSTKVTSFTPLPSPSTSKSTDESNGFTPGLSFPITILPLVILAYFL